MATFQMSSWSVSLSKIHLVLSSTTDVKTLTIETNGETTTHTHTHTHQIYTLQGGRCHQLDKKTSLTLHQLCVKHIYSMHISSMVLLFSGLLARPCFRCWFLLSLSQETAGCCFSLFFPLPPLRFAFTCKHSHFNNSKEFSLLPFSLPSPPSLRFQRTSAESTAKPI